MAVARKRFSIYLKINFTEAKSLIRLTCCFFFLGFFFYFKTNFANVRFSLQNCHDCKNYEHEKGQKNHAKQHEANNSNSRESCAALDSSCFYTEPDLVRFGVIK